MKKLKLKSFSDCQHGWIAVERQLLIDLGILEKITRYSYQKGDTVYLEEDQDATTFIEAYHKKYAQNDQSWKDLIELKNHISNRSTIRSYSHFKIKPVPKLETGMKFKLYSHEYTAIEKSGRDWRAVNNTGKMFRIKASQLDDVEAMQ